MKPSPIYRGCDRWIHRLQGRWHKSRLKLSDLELQAQAIHAESESLTQLDDERLKVFRNEVRDGVLRNKLKHPKEMSRPLAVIAELMFRTTGRRPYVVQLMGALVLARGFAIEMATGEGKTITASLAAALGAWKGDPVHVVTSNDYLAERDALEMSVFYNACDLEVGFVTGESESEHRHQAYAKPITYATGSQLLADYLRDRLVLDVERDTVREKVHLLGLQRADQRVMRGLYTVIVDEADSVLVDDATTPLIISFPVDDPELQQASAYANSVIEEMLPQTHYDVFIKSKSIRFTALGEAWIKNCHNAFPSSWKEIARSRFLVRQALNARHFQLKDRQYVVREGKVVIVDEKTGRLMPNRSWSHGLHQAVEAKEGLDFSTPTKTTVKMSFQNFFRLYRHRSGMSGTFQGVRNELWEIYGLPVFNIPRRLPSKTNLLPDRLYESQEDKMAAIVEEIRSVGSRPVLVGVRSILESERLSNMLHQEGLDHVLLNAKTLDAEAEIIAGAGQPGRVTLATNMAGRGTDIKLSDEIAQRGGLHVIATERHDSRRVDLQLFGRAGRQGQPGSGIAMLSLDDDLLQRYLKDSIRIKLKKMLYLPLGRRVMTQLYILFQSLSEFRASSLRFRILLHDMDFQKMLSFAKH